MSEILDQVGLFRASALARLQDHGKLDRAICLTWPENPSRYNRDTVARQMPKHLPLVARRSDRFDRRTSASPSLFQHPSVAFEQNVCRFRSDENGKVRFACKLTKCFLFPAVIDS